MQSQDIAFLEGALASFIDASIHRVAHSGDMQYSFRITAAEIKTATNRQRLHDTVVREYEAFFSSQGVRAIYDNNFAFFGVTIDLNRCVLSHRQAEFLSAAIAAFRAENT